MDSLFACFFFVVIIIGIATIGRYEEIHIKIFRFIKINLIKRRRPTQTKAK